MIFWYSSEEQISSSFDLNLEPMNRIEPFDSFLDIFRKLKKCVFAISDDFFVESINKHYQVTIVFGIVFASWFEILNFVLSIKFHIFYQLFVDSCSFN